MCSALRRAVVGTATGYRPAQLEVFVRSLRGTGYPGDIILLTGTPDKETSKFFRDYQVTPVYFQPQLLSGRRGSLLHGLLRPFAQGEDLSLRALHKYWLPINSARFIAYQEFFLAHSGCYSEVILADTRDVYFQKNPFEAPGEPPLQFFEEHAQLKIGSCPFNSRWIRQGYGRAALRQMKELTVICAGVIYARGTHLLPFLDAMASEIVRTHSRHNLDQGILNRLARQQAWPQAVIQPQSAAWALHLGCSPRSAVYLNERQEVCNEQGQVAAVVHQYDRHPDLQALIRQRMSLS